MIARIKTYLLWKFYYQYKYLKDVDEDGSYTFFQKCIMFLHITYFHTFGEYWTVDKLHDKISYGTGEVSDILYNALRESRPCMIARFGLIELTVVSNYVAIINKRRSLWNYITGKSLYGWWNKRMRMELQSNAGFFPNTSEAVTQYCKLMLNDSKILDILAAWVGKEPIVIGYESVIRLVGLQEMEPWWQENPWTRVLEGKKVVVVHPFAELIETQYLNKRELLFKNKSVLPKFELRTVKAVQSIGGECNNFENWFEALEWMKSEISKKDYDIALIGCGAYGFPLAAYVKRAGKKAVHLGGVLQLLFGIKGSRWENKNYHPAFDYTTLFNEHWVKAGKEYMPSIAHEIEGGCYW